MFKQKPIVCTTVSFRAIKALKKNGGLPIRNAKVLLWVSHNNPYYQSVDNIQALADSFYKIFSPGTTLELVVTGYLNRHNYYTDGKSNEVNEKFLAEAIKQGLSEQEEWLSKMRKNFGDVKIVEKDWKDCINSSKNIYYSSCKEIVQQKLKESNLKRSFEKTAKEYVKNHFEDKIDIRTHNSKVLLEEECAWLPTLKLQGYTHIIYFGEQTSAIKAMFNDEDFDLKSIVWMNAKFSSAQYDNPTVFKLAYLRSDMKYHGFSYAISNPESIKDLPLKNKPSFKLPQKLKIPFFTKENGKKDMSAYGIPLTPTSTNSIFEMLFKKQLPMNQHFVFLLVVPTETDQLEKQKKLQDIFVQNPNKTPSNISYVKT